MLTASPLTSRPTRSVRAGRHVVAPRGGRQNIRETALAADVRTCSPHLAALIPEGTARDALALVAHRAHDAADLADLVTVLGLSYVTPTSQAHA